MSILSFPIANTKKNQSDQIMQDVIIALIPGIIAYSYFFGLAIIVQIILGLITAFICEKVISLLRKRKITKLDIRTTIITVIILAICIPTASPYYIIIIASSFAIILAKSLFGGVGMNIFNPAMVGFCVVYLSFAYSMSLWPDHYLSLSQSFSLIFMQHTSDMTTGATELAKIKASIQQSSIDFTNHYILLNIFWLLGGCYLWFRKSADWVLGVTFLVSFLAICFIYSLFIQPATNPFTQIILGATIFTSCFIITDPVTAPSSKKARFIYAILVGFIAATIRQFSHMPDSMAFAILLGNLCVPLIDDLIKPQYEGKIHG